MREGNDAQLQLAICDDGPLDREQIAQMVRAILREEKLPAAISRFESGAALISAIRAGRTFHILLLDVMMEEMDGLALAAALRAQDEEASIIFVSTNREMALRGYEVAAARYLAKPLEREKLREALLFCCKARAGGREILLPTSKGQSKIAPGSILYVETWERGVRLNLSSGKVIVKMGISQIAARLPKEQFAYCHRTLLVNLACIDHIRYCELDLKNGERLPISKYRFTEFKQQFLHYLKT